jgi:hypothetical protein
MDADTEDGEVRAARQSGGVRVPSVPGAPHRKGRAREGDRYLGLPEERTDEGTEERYRTGDEGRRTKILSHQEKCPSFILFSCRRLLAQGSVGQQERLLLCGVGGGHGTSAVFDD